MEVANDLFNLLLKYAPEGTPLLQRDSADWECEKTIRCNEKGRPRVEIPSLSCMVVGGLGNFFLLNLLAQSSIEKCE